MKKKNAIFVKKQVNNILEWNLLITKNGFFAVNNAGILSQKKINILMEALESHYKKIKVRDKRYYDSSEMKEN